MFRCKCLKTLKNSVAFITHVLDDHVEDYPLRSYRCIGSCTRGFGNIYSFCKHLKACHPEFSTESQELIPNFRDEPSFNNSLNTTAAIGGFDSLPDSDDCFKIRLSTTTSSEIPNIVSPQLSIATIPNNQASIYQDRYLEYLNQSVELNLNNELEKETKSEDVIQQCALVLNAKLYAANDLSRKRVQHCIVDVNDCVNTVTSVIEQSVLDILSNKFEMATIS